MKKRLKKYITISFGILLVAVAFNLFLSPYSFASNGVSGLAIIVKKFTGIKEGFFILIANIILLIISYIFLGFKKTKHSLIGSILFPICVSLTSDINKLIILKDLDPLIIALLGGVISGIGYGMVYQNDYTTGGTDILNQIMEKYCKIPMSKSIMYIDGMVVLLSFVTFGFTKMIYSLIVLYLISELSNRTMLKINRHQIMYIQSKKVDDIKKYISNEYNYTVTLLQTRGGYTKEKTKTLFCAVKKRDYYPIKEGILLIDPKAFITVVTSYEQLNGQKINTQTI